MRHVIDGKMYDNRLPVRALGNVRWLAWVLKGVDDGRLHSSGSAGHGLGAGADRDVRVGAGTARADVK